jgi:hypothetical protein
VRPSLQNHNSKVFLVGYDLLMEGVGTQLTPMQLSLLAMLGGVHILAYSQLETCAAIMTRHFMSVLGKEFNNKHQTCCESSEFMV